MRRNEMDRRHAVHENQQHGLVPPLLPRDRQRSTMVSDDLLHYCSANSSDIQPGDVLSDGVGAFFVH